jgi:hypothetical protein
MSHGRKTKVYYWKKGTSLDYMVKGKTPTKEEFEKDYVELPIESDKDNLESIFEDFNIGKSHQKMSLRENQDWIRQHGLSHTSMSVGDVAKINNDFYIVKDVGWKKLFKK